MPMPVERKICWAINHSKEMEKVRNRTIDTWQYLLGVAGVWLPPALVFNVLSGFKMSSSLKEKYRGGKVIKRKVFLEELDFIRDEHPEWQFFPEKRKSMRDYLNTQFSSRVKKY
jgi:hypothetical protein